MFSKTTWKSFLTWLMLLFYSYSQCIILKNPRLRILTTSTSLRVFKSKIRSTLNLLKIETNVCILYLYEFLQSEFYISTNRVYVHTHIYTWCPCTSWFYGTKHKIIVWNGWNTSISVLNVMLVLQVVHL